MDYSGMTVNERLEVSGMNSAFEKAIKRKDKEEMVKILQQLKVDEPGQTHLKKIIKRGLMYRDNEP